MQHHEQAINPPGWAAPKGYNNGMLIDKILFVAGQIAWDKDQKLVGKGNFPEQFQQALSNVRAVVEAAGGHVHNIGKLTIYVTDKTLYVESLRDVGAAYKEVFGKHFPAMALVEVAGLLEENALVEIEAMAVISDS